MYYNIGSIYPNKGISTQSKVIPNLEENSDYFNDMESLPSINKNIILGAFLLLICIMLVVNYL